MRIRVILVAALVLSLSMPAMAWGPKGQLAVVTTAVRLLAKSGNIPLTRLENDLRAGSMIPPARTVELFPNMDADLVSAIESEMYLLESVRGSTVDAYFAYRLGALGKLVAMATSPMRTARPAYRNQYYADVEANIDVALKNQALQKVVPRDYFPLLQSEIDRADELLVAEYQTGAGFEGVARNTLPASLGRSIMAVADVWYTVLTTSSSPEAVSDVQRRNYVLNAYDFYIARRNTAEIDAAAVRLDALVAATPDMRVQVGDMYTKAGFPERAVAEYEAVLLLDPDRRDVVEKISEYYMAKGEEAMEAERLGVALENFSKALEVNPLHATAQARKLAAERLIGEREGRQAADRAALQRGEEFEILSEDEAKRGRFAEAIVLLRQAELAYEEVTQEFPQESREREEGLSGVRQRVAVMKQELVANTQDFSGDGFELDARLLTEKGTEGLDRSVLQAMMKAEYDAALQALEESMQPVIKAP